MPVLLGDVLQVGNICPTKTRIRSNDGTMAEASAAPSIAETPLVAAIGQAVVTVRGGGGTPSIDSLES